MTISCATFLNRLPDSGVLILGKAGETWTDKVRFSTSKPTALPPAYDTDALKREIERLENQYFSAVFLAWGISALVKDRALFEMVMNVLEPGGDLFAVEGLEKEDSPANNLHREVLQIFYGSEILPWERINTLLKKAGLSRIRHHIIYEADELFSEKDREKIRKTTLDELKEIGSADSIRLSQKISQNGVDYFPFMLLTARKKGTGSEKDGGRKDFRAKTADLALREKALQRLMEFGPENLSDEEALAVALDCSLELAGKILLEFGGRAVLKDRDRKKLASTLGTDDHMAGRILALLETGRRLFHKSAGDLPVMKSPEDAFNYLSDMHYLKKEHLRGLYLDIRGRIIFDEVLSIGTLSKALVSPREILAPALEHGASGLIIAHNHNSGNAAPSDADEELTALVESAAELMKIDLWDHIIIAGEKYYSFNENGKLKCENYRGRRRK